MIPGQARGSVSETTIEAADQKENASKKDIKSKESREEVEVGENILQNMF